MGQLSWLFELPDNVRLGPKEGRHLLSRILNDTPNLASIFHYRNGAPICGANADVMATMRANLATPAERLQANNDAAYPTSRVYALGRVVSVIALNEDVAEAADAAAIPIARALTKEFGEAPRMRRIDSPCEAIESDRTWLYECRAFIPVAGLEETRSFLSKTPAEMLDVVRSKLWDGMERQARVMNLDLPDIREDLLSLEMDEPRASSQFAAQGPPLIRRCLLTVAFWCRWFVSQHTCNFRVTGRLAHLPPEETDAFGTPVIPALQ